MNETQDSNAEYAFVKEFCVPFLLGAQNQDGGWGFYPNSESRVESTCWAIRALRNSQVRLPQECLKTAVNNLLNAQLGDGSWSAAPQGQTGSWVTSLACSILAEDKTYEREVRAGLKWLCADYPRDSSLWMRLLRRLHPSEPVTPMDDSVRGWGWTPHTSSWVEPTAFAMQALCACPSEWRPGNFGERVELAIGLLYDRMCPKGGWNCGNPMVYGVEGDALVLPTSWALLALRDQAAHERKWVSLEWLNNIFGKIGGPGSLAIARITLEAYGCELPRSPHKLGELFDARAFLRTTEVVAWTCLALSPKRTWYPPRMVRSESA